MNGVLSASKLMTAAQVRKECAEMRDNPVVMIAMELEVKQKLYEMNRKVSARKEVC
ncbi:hypothetical protein [Bacillus pseudomycoides]|uniref:hypothetical protein n=1 Tax=Bacillus pseudomycoides TaxID=64104 RepID=UPI0015CF42EF|nr:hypothetical protein [Bacillus pseudomycoides]